jgi:hypothetical protein
MLWVEEKMIEGVSAIPSAVPLTPRAKGPFQGLVLRANHYLYHDKES